jgi:threonine dehydrogenase-like Zn-dependent dehydrogenase
MKALCWHGTEDVRVETVPDPRIQDSRDVIVRIAATAICVHLYDGFMPTMEKGDILGHEPMGEVVEVGRGITTLKVGDRVVIPFTISCGSATSPAELFLSCDTEPERGYGAQGHGPIARGLLGYSHMLGASGGRRVLGALADVARSRFPRTPRRTGARFFRHLPLATWRQKTPD